MSMWEEYFKYDVSIAEDTQNKVNKQVISRGNREKKTLKDEYMPKIKQQDNL